MEVNKGIRPAQALLSISFYIMDYRTDAPAILREFLVYHETIQNHSRKTVDEYFLDLRNFFRYLKLQRRLVPADTPMDSVSIDDPGLMAEEKLAVLMGSEGDGLTETTIAASDYTVKIPMYHGVDSLNVAAASAVAFWQLRNK